MTKMERAAQLADLATQWYDIADRTEQPTRLLLQAKANKWAKEASQMKNEALAEMGFASQKTSS